MAAPSIIGSVADRVQDTSLVLTHGLTILSGDLLVAFGIAGSGPTRVFTGIPSGFTEVINEDSVNFSAGNFHSHLWYKVAGGSEPSTYTWTGNDSYTYQSIILVQIRDAGDPSTDLSANYADILNSGATQTSQGITVTNNDSLVIMGIESCGGNSTFTAPGSTTETAEQPTSPSASACYFTANSGATGTKDWTVSPTYRSWYAFITMFIGPSGGGGGSIIPIFDHHYRMMRK